MMADIESNSAPTYVIALPGAWTILPLENADSLADAIATVIEETAGTAPAQALIRRELFDAMLGTARQALDGGAEFLAVAPYLIPGIPFGAALTARTVPVPTGVELPSGALRNVAERESELAGNTVAVLAVNYILRAPDGNALALAFTAPARTASPEALLPLFDTIADAVTWTEA